MHCNPTDQLINLRHTVRMRSGTSPEVHRVKWAYSDVYLSQTRWNHAKNSMERRIRPTSVFLQWDVGVWPD